MLNAGVGVTAAPAGSESARRLGQAGLLIAALGLGGLGVWATRTQQASQTPIATSSSAPAPVPASASSLPIDPSHRPTFTIASAQRACREWSARILETQAPNGTFRGQTNREPTGWDTAQILAALSFAQPECGGSPVVLSQGARGLSLFRGRSGFTGIPAKHAAGAKALMESPATAWAALALDQMSELSPESTGLRTDSELALDLLTRPQFADGSLPFLADHDNQPDTYSTVLGARALIEAGSAKHASARDKALAWLRASLSSASPRSVNTIGEGLVGHTLWVLHRARHKKLLASSDDVFVAGAAELVRQCSLDSNRRCTHLLLGDKFIPLGQKDNQGSSTSILMLWHPWTTLASTAIAADMSIPLSAELRADLRDVARWTGDQIEASIAMYGPSDAYKIAEQLVAVSLLLEQSRQP